MDIPWEVINVYFRDNPEFIVKHHLDSYNSFFYQQLPQILLRFNSSITIPSGVFAVFVSVK